MGLGLFVGAWVARYLGPEQFGIFNYAVAVVGLLTPVATLGLDTIVVRELVRNTFCREEILGTAFALKIISGVLTLLLVIILTSLLRLNDELSRWLVGITATGMVFQSFDIIDFWFQSQTQAKYTIYARNAAYLIVNLVKISFIQMQAPLIAFAWVGLAEIALSAVGLVIAYQISGHSLKTWRYSFTCAKELLKNSCPLILSGIVIMVYMRIDQIMLGQVKDSKAVGLYSVVMKLAEVWYFIPGVITSSVFPSLIKAKEVSEELYSKQNQKLFNLISVLAYVVAIPLTFLSSLIVKLIYGEQYIEAGPLLAIYVWSGIFVFLGTASTPWMITEGLVKFSAITSTIGAIANIALNSFLISRYSILGATISTIVSQFIASCGAYALYTPTRKLFFMQLKAIFLLDLLNFSKNSKQNIYDKIYDYFS